VPRWQTRHLQVSQERRFELETEARKTVAQVLAARGESR
jgi:hypothetical protein